MAEWKMHHAKFEADEINKQLAVSPWSGHRQFAYDLISNLRPDRIVELGTHYGCSFFTFMQACKDNNLNSEIIAIDCWEGDPQAGFYGDEVWNTVNITINKLFKHQNYKLIRKYFNDALEDILDESADILHIDGLHTYDAVKEDFYNWLPKLKQNGIIIFHDVQSKLGYGSDIFWKELTLKYKYHYMFSHSWGLGILFPKGGKNYTFFEEINMKDKIHIYEYQANYELLDIQLADHKKMVEARDKSIASMTEMINEKDKSMALMTEMINNRDKSIASMTEMINEKDRSMASMTEMINDRDKSIVSMTEMINEKDRSMASMTEMINDRDKSIISMTEMINDRDKSIASMTEMINDRDKSIASMTKMIDDRDMCIASMTEMINDRDAIINSFRNK